MHVEQYTGRDMASEESLRGHVHVTHGAFRGEPRADLSWLAAQKRAHAQPMTGEHGRGVPPKWSGWPGWHDMLQLMLGRRLMDRHIREFGQTVD